MPNNLQGQNISDTYQRLLQIEGGALTDGTGSAVIVPSASYAISASHEITYEVSSSYAETSSYANNVTRLTTTVAELNHLDGITATNATHVKTMNQSVASSASPEFLIPKANTLFRHTYSGPTGPSKLTMTNPDGSVGFYIATAADSRIMGFVAEGDEKSYIDQLGNFSGQAATVATIAGLAPNTATTQATQPNITSVGTLTSITSTGNSTLGNAATDTHTFTGPITASGNISASGNIYGASYVIKGSTLGAILLGSTNNIILGNTTDDTTIFGNTISTAAGDPVTINAPLTASGNISASATMTARNFEYPTSNNTTVGSSTGDIITWGTATATTAGQIYYYNASGAWTVADADALSSAKSLIAVALDDNSSKGMLLRGVTTLHTITGTQDEGAPLYLKATADGHANINAPTTSGHIVRIIGYCLNTAKLVWFDPDKTWVELS